MVGLDDHRKAERTAIGRDRHLRTEPLRARGLDTGDRRADGRPQVGLAVQSAAVVECIRQVASTACAVVRPARLRRARSRGPAPGRPPRRRAPPVRLAPGPACGSRDRPPKPSASAASTRRSDMAVGSLITASNDRTPALPVHEGARPLVHQRDREDHIGPLGDQRGAGLQADHEADGLQALQRGSADRAKSFGSTPGHDQRGQLAVGGADQHLVARRGPPGSAASRRPRWSGCRPGRRRRPAAGRRAAGWAGSLPRPRRGRPLAGAPRPAGRRCARRADDTR